MINVDCYYMELPITGFGIIDKKSVFFQITRKRDIKLFQIYSLKYILVIQQCRDTYR